MEKSEEPDIVALSSGTSGRRQKKGKSRLTATPADDARRNEKRSDSVLGSTTRLYERTRTMQPKPPLAQSGEYMPQRPAFATTRMLPLNLPFQTPDSFARAQKHSKEAFPSAMPSLEISSARMRRQSVPTATISCLQTKMKMGRSVSAPILAVTPVAAQIVPVQPKLNKRFYESLVMLRILGKTRGDRIDEYFEPDPTVSSLDTTKERRRSFLKNLAYLCDYDKGGERTTAIALQRTPEMIVFWFASNTTPQGEDKTALFIDSILQTLKSMRGEDVQGHISELFTKAVTFSTKRICYYVKGMKKNLAMVLSAFKKTEVSDDMDFIRWLQNLQEAAKSVDVICELCYKERHSIHYDSLRERAIGGKICAKPLSDIRHIFGRLSHTMKAVRDVITAGIALPALFDDFKVSRVQSTSPSEPPLRDRNPSLDEIVGRLTSNPTEIAQYRQALKEMDEKLSLNLGQTLQEHCSDKNWKPQVHAELLVLNHFETSPDFEFEDQDRYIGCSKAACYCCYHYIRFHPGNYEIPGTSNNCYLKWKAPDIFGDARQDVIERRAKILNSMTHKIREDVFQQIRERRGPKAHRPDSNTEISSIRRGPLPSSTRIDEQSDESSSDEIDDRNSITGEYDDDEFDSRSDAGSDDTPHSEQLQDLNEENSTTSEEFFDEITVKGNDSILTDEITLKGNHSILIDAETGEGQIDSGAQDKDVINEVEESEDSEGEGGAPI